MESDQPELAIILPRKSDQEWVSPGTLPPWALAGSSPGASSTMDFKMQHPGGPLVNYIPCSWRSVRHIFMVPALRLHDSPS